MADFCNACADDLFGPEARGDLAGLTTLGDQMAGYFACVLCEDCGPIQVDWLGNCVSHNRHGPEITYDEYQSDALQAEPLNTLPQEHAPHVIAHR